MEKFSVSLYSQQPGKTTGSKQPEDSKPMFQFRLGPHSQKQDKSHSGAGFAVGLKRSSLDITQSSKLSENISQRGFDKNLSQSPFKLSSRSVESHALGNSAYPHCTPELIDRKPHSTATGTFTRCKDEPIEISLDTRPFASSCTPSIDYPKGSVKAGTEDADLGSALNPLFIGSESDDPFGGAAIKYRLLQKEVVKQHEYITDLETRLAAKTDENSTLSRTLVQAETAHKQAMDRHRDAIGRATKNYSALKSELDDFKLRAESSSSIISEAKATMEDLAALRNSTQLSLRDLESMLDSDGRLVLSAETRNLVHELRCELSKTEQVADLLRDKLQDMGSALAEARARILELQESVVTEKNRCESVTLKLRQSADQMVEVTRYLQEQKHESNQAAAKAYEMEQQFVHTQTRLQEAQSMITSMREQMDAQEEFHREQEMKLRTLRHTIDFQEDRMKDLDARVRRAEEELVQALNHTHELQGRLDSAKGMEKNLTQQASRLLTERDEAKERLQSIERQLAEMQASEKSLSSELAKAMIERNAFIDKLKSFDDAKRERDKYREQYADCQLSLKVLQERVDDQCVTLAASKETIGELQERVHAAERQASEKLIESKGEISYLRERQALLQTKSDQMESELRDKTSSCLTLQVELSRKEGAFQALLEIEQRRAKDALGQLQDAKSTIDSLLTQLAQKEYHIQEVAKHLAAAEAPALEREREVASLKARISELEAIEKKLLDRAMTITQRYENNDLNDDEKALVALLMQKARAIHDREMVEKANEIKRRDNIIKQHEARITQLEEVLTRRIYDESRTASPKSGDEQGNSMTVDTKPRAQGLHSDQHPEIRGEGASTSGTQGAADATVNPFLLGPSSRSTGHSTFAKLCREDTDDIAEFEDEKPQGTTGKRVMFADDIEDESSRPARRVKQGKFAEAERTGGDKAAVPASATGTGPGAGAANKRKAPRRR